MEAEAQNVIAIMSDFDRTLSPSCLTPLFKERGITEDEFLKLANDRYNLERADFLRRVELEEAQLPEHLRINPRMQERSHPSPEVAYFNVLLDLVRENEKFRGLSRAELRELGREVKFYDGAPDFVREMKEEVQRDQNWSKHKITLEFHIVSSGPAEIIRGTSISSFCNGIFGLETYAVDPTSMTDPIHEVVSPMTFTDKTGVVHKVHKGPDVHVNDYVPPHLRRVSGSCLIYMGDGSTDVPPMSATRTLGGRSIAVYTPGNIKTAFDLRDQDRVFAYGPADFRQGSVTRDTLQMLVRKAAEGIIYRHEKMIREGTGRGARF